MASLTDLYTSLQDGVAAINKLTAVIKAVFPQAGALSATATTGAVTFNSSQPATFLTVVTSSGGTYKTPLYNP